MAFLVLSKSTQGPVSYSTNGLSELTACHQPHTPLLPHWPPFGPKHATYGMVPSQGPGTYCSLGLKHPSPEYFPSFPFYSLQVSV